MSIFDWLKRGGQPVPYWAAVMSPAEFSEFFEVVTGYAKTRLRKSRIDIEQGVIQTDSGVHIGLHNLVQTCAQSDKENWIEVVTRHMSLVAAPAEPPTDFEEAMLVLMPRLFARMDELENGRFWGFEKVPGVVTMLVYDLPEMVVGVPTSDMEIWGLPHEQLWEVAMRNLWSRSPAEVKVLDEARKLYSLEGDGTFEATHILHIERFVDAPSHGLLIIIPTRDVLIWKPVDDFDAFEYGAPDLAQIARQAYADRPASLTTSLYWRVNDALFEIEATWEGEKLALHFDQESHDLYQKLREGSENLS